MKFLILFTKIMKKLSLNQILAIFSFRICINFACKFKISIMKEALPRNCGLLSYWLEHCLHYYFSVKIYNSIATEITVVTFLRNVIQIIQGPVLVYALQIWSSLRFIIWEQYPHTTLGNKMVTISGKSAPSMLHSWVCVQVEQNKLSLYNKNDTWLIGNKRT